MKEPETRLDEYSKEEWRDVARAARPDWTDEEFNAAWERFMALKRRRAYN